MGGDLTELDFSKALLETEFGAAPPAVHYLYAYLEHLKAGVMLRELHYVDRHFLDDFADYYARSFRAPSPSCRRYHFFADLTPAQLSSLLDKAYESPGDLAEVERLLQEKYLGFVVRRPIGHAPVGRTVLKTYEADGGRRHYTVTRPYRVHVAGIRLQIDGLAFQQQDGGTAVCASMSLWSALQQVALVAGHRTPTPSAITRAAKSPYPANIGLGLPQMATALVNLGYVADAFHPSTSREAFRSKLASCLDSHLPVVLLITRDEDAPDPSRGKIRAAHAVTVTGYSEPTTIVEVPGPGPGAPSVRMRSASLEILYVHDDNLGSHAHFELVNATSKNELGQEELLLRRGRANQPPLPWWTVTEWKVLAALVPKPEKLRMSVDDVFSQVWLVRPIAERLFPGLNLHYATRFAAGTEYRRQLMENAVLDRDRMRGFQSALTLPRHIGVVAVTDDSAVLCEFVLDISHVDRSGKPPLLAVVGHGVPMGSRAWVDLNALSKHVSLPLLVARAST